MKVHVGSSSPCALLLHRHFLLFPLISGSSFASLGRGVGGGRELQWGGEERACFLHFSAFDFHFTFSRSFMQSFSSSFFIIFVIYETVFIISYCSLAAADGLSTRKGNMPRPCSDFSKITRVFPYLLPCSFFIFSLATSLFCAFYQKFVFHSVCWPRLLQTFQWIERGKREGGGKGKRVARVSCMLHGVCTIFLTSSQI